MISRQCIEWRRERRRVVVFSHVWVVESESVVLRKSNAVPAVASRLYLCLNFEAKRLHNSPGPIANPEEQARKEKVEVCTGVETDHDHVQQREADMSEVEHIVM